MGGGGGLQNRNLIAYRMAAHYLGENSRHSAAANPAAFQTAKCHEPCFVVAPAHVLQLRQLALIFSLFFRMPKLQPCSVVSDGLHSRRVSIFFPGMLQVARGAAAGGASTRNMLTTQLLDERVQHLQAATMRQRAHGDRVG